MNALDWYEVLKRMTEFVVVYLWTFGPVNGALNSSHICHHMTVQYEYLKRMWQGCMFYNSILSEISEEDYKHLAKDSLGLKA
jgi:hypothetical protein